MTNENNSWKARRKYAATAWWNRNGWKFIAIVAVAFAIAFGLIAGVERVELVHLDPSGPNWAEVMTGIATALLASFTALLALGGSFALLAVVEARRARNAVQMTDMSKRWDEETSQEVRRKVHEYAKTGLDGCQHVEAGPHRLKESVQKLRVDNHDDYRKLWPDPNFLEGIAILVDRGGMDFEIVKSTLGYVVPYRWTLWQPTITADREQSSTSIYVAFESLAKRIAREDPTTWKFDTDGNLVWRGFME
jgi:hypothetical protein